MQIQRIIIILAITGCLGLGACQNTQMNNMLSAGAGSLVRASAVSAEQVRKDSLQVITKMDQDQPRAARGNAYDERLRKMTTKLSNYKGLELNFAVYLDPNVNAFATPDGSIRVFSGLMDLMEDDELLAVVGHEIGHVHSEHSLWQMRKAMLARGLREALAASEYGSLASGALGGLGESAINARFSQEDELESDVFALQFLRELGEDPRAMLRAIKKLESSRKGGVGFLSSHPSNPARQTNIKRNL